MNRLLLHGGDGTVIMTTTKATRVARIFCYIRANYIRLLFQLTAIYAESAIKFILVGITSSQWLHCLLYASVELRDNCNDEAIIADKQHQQMLDKFSIATLKHTPRRWCVLLDCAVHFIPRKRVYACNSKDILYRQGMYEEVL